MTHATANIVARTRGLPFSPGKTALLVVIGVALWFAAAMLLRVTVELGALDGATAFLTYALIVPGTWPFVLLTQSIARLADHEIGLGIGVVTMAALLADGIAVGWFPAIYSADDAQALKCAAAVFWGAGVGLAIAFVLNRPVTT